MDRPVFVGLLAVVVVAAAGVGVLDAGMGTGRGANGGDSGTSAATAGPPATATETGTVPPTGVRATTPGSESGGSMSKQSNAGGPLRPGTGSYPPGTSPDGIEKPRKLLRSHTAVLSRTGFVVESRANATVLETGMRIDATTRGGARVASGANEYYAYRIDTAGPLQRRTEGWYGGSVEHHRQVSEFGSVDESTREARSVGELAGRPLLAPHLRGGVFERVRVTREGEERRFVFTAQAVFDERIVVEGLPETTTEIRSYEARVVVDSAGRIRSFRATVEYVIGGEREIHHLEYALTRVENVTVERPEWAEETTADGASARGDSQSERTEKTGPVLGPWTTNRIVAITL